MHERTGGQSRQATGAKASNLDLYQVNSTYYDVLGRRETDYLIARALQFFAPGIPQVYYIGLLGTPNDMDLLHSTDVGREINRHYFAKGEVKAALETPMVRALTNLIRFRNDHPAFGGSFMLAQPSESEIHLSWQSGDHWARLEVDCDALKAMVHHSSAAGDAAFSIAPVSV